MFILKHVDMLHLMKKFVKAWNMFLLNFDK
jgi:hypothetical protein